MIGRIKWLFFGLAFAVSTLEFGLVYSFGALFTVIKETFHTDRPTAAAVQSLLIGVMSCFGVISGILINKFGLHVVTLVSSILVSSGFAVSYFITDIWYLYASISIVAGAGISMIFLSSITLINTVFTGKQRTLCLAIHGTCNPIAGIVYPYLLDFLASTYGLSGTFLVLGGIFCNTFVFSLLIWLYRGELTPNKQCAPDEENFRHSNSQVNKTLLIADAVKFVKELMSRRYVCLLVAIGLALSTVNGYLDFVYDITSWKEYDKSKAKMSFVIFNVSGCVFCCIPGVMKLILDIDIYIYPFLFSVSGLSGSLMIYFSKTYAVYVVGTALVGTVPAIVTCSFIIYGQLMRLEQIAVATGIMITIIGLLSAGTGPLFGAIRDKSGSYSLVFAIISTAQAIAALLFIADIIQRRLNKNASARNVFEVNDNNS